MSEQRTCDNCGRAIDPKETPYWVRLEMFASPEPPHVDPDEGDREYAAEMQALIEQMEKLGPEECEAQVYEVYKFVICPTCRADFHRRLRKRKMDMS